MAGRRGNLKDCELEISDQAEHLACDGTEVVSDRGDVDVSKDTVFTSRPLRLKNQQRLELTVEGAAVLRIGLLSEKPEHQYYFQDALFETEDGFGPGLSSRSLYVANNGYLCYGEPDAEREFLSVWGTEYLYLYIMVVYGRPKITGKYGGKSIEWSTFEDSNIGLASSGKQAICGIVSSAKCCMVKECLVNNYTYELRWKMELVKQKLADKQPEYGFIRVGITTKKPDDLFDIELNSGNPDIVWYTENAVADYPYSGKLAILVKPSEGTVTHNVLKTSVGDTTTDKLQPGSNQLDTLYMVVEMSHGSMSVFCGENIDVLQPPGTIVHVKNYKEFDNQTDLYFDIARHGLDPCKIQYGLDPKSFILEFHEKLQPQDMTKLTKGLTRTIKVLNETKAVQVLNVPEELKYFDLNMFFTRPEACGGDQFESLEREEEFPGTWIITYKSTEVARRVFSKSQYSIEGHLVNILPYYQELGCSITGGDKPVYDREPYFINTDTIDEDKLRFVRNSAPETIKFKQFVKANSGAAVAWLDQEMSDSEDEDEEDMLSVECGVGTNDYRRLAQWKDKAGTAVKNYFSEEVIDKYVDIESNKWDSSLALLEQLMKSLQFDYVPDEDSETVKLISSNTMAVKKILTELGKIEDKEQSMETLSGVHAEKCIALDAENGLHKLAKRFTGTRFKMDRSQMEVEVKGPKCEIDSIMPELQKLMLRVQDVSVEISPDCAKVAKTVSDELSKVLKKQGLNERVKITNNTASLYTVVENAKDVKRKEEKLKNCIDSVVRVETIPLEDKVMNGTVKTMKGSFEERYGVILKNDKKGVKIIGPVNNVSELKKALQDVKMSDMKQFEKMYISKDVAEYLATYEFIMRDATIECTFEHFDDQYTGQVLLKGHIEEQARTKATLDKECKEINMFWFSISKPWLASIVESIPIQRVIQKHECNIIVEIGDALAPMNVSAVSIMAGRNVIIQTQQSKLEDMMQVDVLVNVANPDLTVKSKEGQTVLDAAGPAVKSECFSYVKKHGRLQDGDVLLTTAGYLPLRSIIHAVVPQFNTGDGNKLVALQRMIQNILQVADRERLFTIALPVHEIRKGGFPEDAAIQCTLQAVKEHFEKNKSTVVETVYLCEEEQACVDVLSKAFGKYLGSSPWVALETGRNSQSGNTDTSAQRPKSARPKTGIRQTDEGRQRQINPFSWMQNEPIPSGSFSWKGGIQQALAEEEDDVLPGIKDEWSNGLPYLIDLSPSTRLHIVKGTIEKQKVDVIVNTTTKFPDLSGAVSNAIQKAGGRGILAECKKYTGGNFECGQVYRSGGGDLDCKRLYHVIIDSVWADRTYGKVHQTVKTCLAEASKFKCVSIAFPTFGTGFCKFPPDEVAEAMIRSVYKYVESNRVTSIKDVYIVVFYADVETIQSFEASVPSLLSDMRNVLHGKGDGSRKRLKRPKPRQKAGYNRPANSSKHSNADDVLLVKVTHKKTHKAEQIREDFTKLVDEEYVTKDLKLTTQKDDEVLSHNEERMLKLLETDHKIKVEIDTTKGMLKLSGLQKDVQNAEMKANDMLLRQFPETRTKKKMAQVVVEHVQWLYMDTDGKQKPVCQESNLEIYMGYIKGKDFTYKNRKMDGDTVYTEYKFIVGKLEEHPVSDPSKKRRLYQRNRVLSGIEVPLTWNIHTSGKDKEHVDLPPGSAEFNNVKKKLIKDGCPSKNIRSVTRIENRYMWQQYQSKKRQLQAQNPKGTKNEQDLWHGTDEHTYNAIAEKGYDRSFAGKNATAYGTGSYFATASSYSHRYAVADQSGIRRIFLNKVLTGVTCAGNGGMDVLPTRDTSKNQVINYDSAVDNVRRPSIFVIFHDTQAYPEYLITYK